MLVDHAYKNELSLCGCRICYINFKYLTIINLLCSILTDHRRKAPMIRLVLPIFFLLLGGGSHRPRPNNVQDWRNRHVFRTRGNLLFFHRGGECRRRTVCGRRNILWPGDCLCNRHGLTSFPGGTSSTRLEERTIISPIHSCGHR